MRSAAPSARRVRVVESFQGAGEAIGKIEPGLAVFAVTRGQWSMIDAISWCLAEVGPAALSLWTWTVAEYEVKCLEALMGGQGLTSGLLVIDGGARAKNSALLAQWRAVFGGDSVKICLNHSKIATIETANFRLLLRGSMNLNFNPRFEQFDLTEGGADFDLVKKIESELDILPDSAPGSEAYRVSKVSAAFDKETLEMFRGVKVWAK